MSSTGAEILCLMVPDEKERFVVRFLRSISGEESEVLADLLAVKALDRDIFAEYGGIVTFSSDKLDTVPETPLPSINETVGCLTAVDYGMVGSNYPNR